MNLRAGCKHSQQLIEDEAETRAARLVRRNRHVQTQRRVVKHREHARANRPGEELSAG